MAFQQTAGQPPAGAQRAVVARVFTILATVFLLIGLVGYGVAGAFAIAESQSGRVAKADGVIVEDGYRATIQFTTPSGQVVRFRNSVNSTSNVVGDHVPVAYDPAKPERADADAFAGRWFFAVLAAIIASPMFFVGLGFAIAALALRSRRRAELVS